MGERKGIGWRAKLRRIVHSAYFEPVLSIAIIAVVILSLYAYTDNWPPMVVVESESMQHGYSDIVGIINTGDIVLVKQTSVPSGVTTYVEGEQSGYSTYGEYGDVLLYNANGNTGGTPIIHRAIVWLTYAGAQGFEIPTLYSLACSPTSEEQYVLENDNGASPHCLASPDAPELGDLILYHVGWNDLNVSISLSTLDQNEPWSGFVTLGDNNHGEYDQTWDGDSCAISCIVQPGWVIGVARGMIPWFGALKLWVDGSATEVPPQSWDYLALTILAIIVVPQAVPWAYRTIRGRSKSTSDGTKEGGTEDGSPPDESWSDVSRLEFEKEKGSYLLVAVEYEAMEKGLLGKPRMTPLEDEVEIEVDSVRDLREGTRRVPVALALGGSEFLDLESMCQVRVLSERGQTVLEIAPAGTKSPPAATEGESVNER